MVAKTLRMGQGRRIYWDLDSMAGTLVQGKVERHPGRPRGSIERNAMEGQIKRVQEGWAFGGSRRQGVLGFHVPKLHSGNAGRRSRTYRNALPVITFVTVRLGEHLGEISRSPGERRDINVIT